MKEKIEGIAFVLDVDPSNIQIVVDRIQAEEVLTMQDVRQLSMVGFPVINSLAKVCDKPTSDIMSLIEGGNIDYPIFEKAVNVVYEQFKPAIDDRVQYDDREPQQP